MSNLRQGNNTFTELKKFSAWLKLRSTAGKKQIIYFISTRSIYFPKGIISCVKMFQRHRVSGKWPKGCQNKTFHAGLTMIMGQLSPEPASLICMVIFKSNSFTTYLQYNRLLSCLKKYRNYLICNTLFYIRIFRTFWSDILYIVPEIIS